MGQGKEVVIVNAVRAAVGRDYDVCKTTRHMAADVIKGLMERNPPVDPATIKEVVFGNVER